MGFGVEIIFNEILFYGQYSSVWWLLVGLSVLQLIRSSV